MLSYYVYSDDCCSEYECVKCCEGCDVDDMDMDGI